MRHTLHRLQAAWRWLRTNITIFTFGVGVATLIFAMLNYFKQSPNRAELASTPNARAELKRVVVQWASIGRKVVQRGSAVLFAFDPQESKRGAELGKARIEGLGTTAFSLTAEFDDIDIKSLPDTVLVCTGYYDEKSKEYNQAFLYRRHTPDSDPIGLDQLASPDYDTVCR